MLCNVGVYIQHIYRILKGYMFKVYHKYIYIYMSTYVVNVHNIIFLVQRWVSSPWHCAGHPKDALGPSGWKPL